MKIPVIFRFRLGDLSWPPQDVGPATVQIKMSGEVLLKSKETYSATVTVSREDLKAQLTSEANHAFAKLVGENKFAFDPASKKVTWSSMLISQSSMPNTVATAFGVEMSSDSPMPKLKAEIKLPTLQGSISGFEYVAVDVAVSIEVTPRPPRSQPQSLRKADQVVAQPAMEPGVSWGVVLGAGLAVAAVGLVVATIVEDFATGGLGLADDPITFSVSGAMLARGLALMGVAAITGAPKASAQARIDLKATVGLQRK